MYVNVQEKDLESPIVRFGLRFFGFICIVVTPFAIFAFWGKVEEGTASTAWPSVQGKITSATIDTTASINGNTYKATIQYAYTVGGTTLKGHRIRTTDTAGSKYRSNAEDLVGQYPPGAVVTVYYNPADPSRAVLEPGVLWTDYLFFLIPVVMLVMGNLCFIITRRKPPRSLTDPAVAAIDMRRHT